MHFSIPSLTALAAILTTSLTTAAPPAAALATRANQVPFTFEYLFTVNINFGAPSPKIPVFGGYRLVVPVLNGTVSGPAGNGTIDTGTVYPVYYAKGEYEEPLIIVTGTFDDGTPFAVQEQGVGTNVSHATRVLLDVGGGQKYQRLREGYILARAENSADRTSLVAKCYLVLDR